MTHAADIYLFSHVILQQAAYQLLPPSVRAGLHDSAVTLLAELRDPPAADLAMHCRLAREGATQFDDRLLKLERHWTNQAAEQAARAYRTADAIRWYLRLTELQKPNSVEQVETLCRLVDLFIDGDRAGEAVPYAERAVAAATDLAPGLRAMAFRALGTSCRDGDRNAETAGYMQRAVELYGETGDDRGLAQALLGLAGALWIQGDLQEAGAAAKESCEIAARVGDPKIAGKAWMNRLGIALAMRAFDQAEPILRRIEELVSNSPDPAEQLRMHSFRAYAYDLLNQKKRARAEYERAMKLAQELGALVEVARCQTNLAVLDAEERRFQTALQRHRAAEKTARELGDLRVAAHACYGQCIVYAYLGDRRSALERIYAAIRIGERLRIDSILPLWYVTAGLLHAELDDLQTAAGLLENAALENEPGAEIARSCALSVIASRKGDTAHARKLARQALKTARPDATPTDPIFGPWIERARQLAD